jgi:hypothetical protein
MKAVIDIDELYPYHVIRTFDIESDEEIVEVPDELIKRYNENGEEFWKIQNELREIKQKKNI